MHWRTDGLIRLSGSGEKIISVEQDQRVYEMLPKKVGSGVLAFNK
jgi:hypothetical protein